VAGVGARRAVGGLGPAESLESCFVGFPKIQAIAINKNLHEYINL
jgi:hypothetical protein